MAHRAPGPTEAHTRANRAHTSAEEASLHAVQAQRISSRNDVGGGERPTRPLHLLAASSGATLPQATSAPGQPWTASCLGGHVHSDASSQPTQSRCGPLPSLEADVP
jgi:hypothetical protein